MKTCPAPKAPKNGGVACSNDDHIIDTECEFSCLPGYTLVGSRHRNCLPLARWDGLHTTCKRESSTFHLNSFLSSAVDCLLISYIIKYLQREQIFSDWTIINKKSCKLICDLQYSPVYTISHDFMAMETEIFVCFAYIKVLIWSQTAVCMCSN